MPRGISGVAALRLAALVGVHRDGGCVDGHG